MLHASTLTVIFVTFERYLAICRPHSAVRLSSKAGFLATITCIWITAGMSSLPFLDMTRLEQSTFYDGSPCEICQTLLRKSWHVYFVVGTTIGFTVLPVILLACFYLPIISRLRARQWVSKDSGRVSLARDNNGGGRRLQRSGAMSSRGYRLRTHRQVIRMLVLIVLFLFLSLVPVRALALWQALGPPGSAHSLGIENYYNLIWMCRMLMYINSAANPLIYSLLSTRFKIAFRLVLRCQGHMLDNRKQMLAARRRTAGLHVARSTSSCSVSNQQSYQGCETTKGNTQSTSAF